MRIRQNQKNFSTDNIKYVFNSYDADIEITLDYNSYVFETNIFPSIIVDYDNKQTRIYAKDQSGRNVLSEIKKMDEYFSSRDFICELLAQSKKRDNEYIEYSDENYINNILACIESYTYESMFNNDNFIANMQKNRDDWIYPLIIKKSLHEREKIPLQALKKNADNYLLKNNNSMYRFGKVSYFKTIGFKFPFAKCCFEIKSINLNHDTKTYKLGMYMGAIQYEDCLQDIDSISIPGNKF